MDKDLVPRYRHEGSIPLRMTKVALNFIIERMGGKRPFEPVCEGGAVAVAHAVDQDDPLHKLPPGTIEADEQNLREHLPERPERPENN